MESNKIETNIAKRLLKYILDGISYEITGFDEKHSSISKLINIHIVVPGYDRYGFSNMSISFIFYCHLPTDPIFFRRIAIITYFGNRLYNKIDARLDNLLGMLNDNDCLEEFQIKLDLHGI